MKFKLILWCVQLWLGVILEAVQSQTVIFPEGCNSSLTKDLRDDLFTASSERGDGNRASDAKVDRAGWVASTYGNEQFLQLDFEKVVEITGLRLTKVNIGWYTRTLRITYSQDGLVWKAYNSRLSEEILGETFKETSNGLIELLLDPVIEARFIVLNPISTNGNAGMRLEVFGCNDTVGEHQHFATRIGEHIESDVVWIPSQSPIVIDRDIIVGAAASVTIQAGVTVVFTSARAGISVHGKLEGSGIVGLHVVFTSNHPLLAVKNKWSGIRQLSAGNVTLVRSTIRQAVIGIQGNGTQLRLHHCLLHSCTDAVRLTSGMELQNEDNFTQGMFESDSILSDTDTMFNTYGVRLHGLKHKKVFVLRRSTFSFSYRGVVIENWDKADRNIIESWVLLHKCGMSDNTDTGVYSSETQYTRLVFLNTSLSRNRQYAIYASRWYGYSNSINVSIINSTLDNSGRVHLSCYGCFNVTHNIQNSKFVKTDLDISHSVRTSDHTQFGRLLVDNNTFTGSKVPLSINMPDSDNMYINANLFNATKGGMALKWDPQRGGDVFASIAGNTFLNIYGESALHMEADNLNVSFTANTIYNSTSSNLIRVVKGSIYMTDNNLTSNVQHTCFVKTDIMYDGKNVLIADHNYWGTADIAEIKAKICDFFLDSSKTPINVHTIYNTSDMTTVQDTSTFDNIKFTFDPKENVYFCGGIVTADSIVDISMFDYPIIVNRSILIKDSVHVTLSGIPVNFNENRGIAVHGYLHIGDSNGNLTVLQAHIRNKKWNGFRLFTPDIDINNSNISGSKTLLDYRTAINVEISNSNLNETNNFIISEKHNGVINITVKSCVMDVEYNMLYLTINNTQRAHISVKNSRMLSRRNYFVLFEESAAQHNVTHITLVVVNSSVQCDNSNRCLRVYSCMSYLVANIFGSTMSASAIVVDIQTLSTYFKLQQNSIKDHSQGVNLQFCNARSQKDNLTRKVEMMGNSFNTAKRGHDLYLYQWYTYETQHQFYILNNTFRDQYGLIRESIRLIHYGNRPSSAWHVFYIKNNTFSRFTRGVYIEGPARTISIENNAFINGRTFIEANFKGWNFGNFLIHNNTIQNNLADAIIKLLQPYSGNATVTVTENWFVNNSGVMMSFDSPFIVLTHNIFENANAQYNVKVSVSPTSYANSVVNASLNFWGTTDVGDIPTTIYDHEYDASLLDVLFRPYLGSKNITDIRDDDATFVRESGEIGGPVNGNIELTLSGSPYTVISNIEVQKSDHLKVHAGVKLIFGANLGMHILGVLNVTGTATEPVLMTSLVAGSPWRGLLVKGNLTSSLVHLTVNDTTDGIIVSGYRTSLHYVTSNFSSNNGISIGVTYQPFNFSNVIYRGLNAFNNSKIGISISLYARNINDTTIQVHECNTAGNKADGIKIDANATVLLHGCKVNQNAGRGLYVYQNQGGTTRVQSSRFDRNVQMAVYVYLTLGFAIDSSTITNHNRQYYYRQNAFIYFYYSQYYKRLRLIISNCRFENNHADGIIVEFESFISLDIFNNTFVQGRKIGTFRSNYYYSSNSSLRITENIIKNNSFTEGNLIDINKRYTSVILNISDNMFMNNSASSAIVLTSSSDRGAQEITIEGNTFLANRMQNVLIDIVSYPKANIHHNVFKNDDVICELRSPMLRDSAFYLNATYNYWGSRGLGTVINKVCGFDKQMERAFVYYMPFYGNELLNRSEEHRHNIFDHVDGYGGEITTTTVLSEITTLKAIPISRSIMIRNGSTLTVGQGLSLLFETGKGIYVEGGLSVIGQEETVNLTSYVDTWYGIVVNSKTDHSSLSNALIENTRHGIKVNTDFFDLKKSEVRNSSSTCLVMHFGADRIYDFQGTLLQNCSKSGIDLSGDGNMTIVNVSIKNVSNGILSNSRYGNFIIRSSDLSMIKNTALGVTFSSSSYTGNVTVESCVISNASKGVDIRVSNYLTNNLIHVNRNIFRNVSVRALDINVPTDNYYSYINLRTVDVGYNKFENACYIHIATRNFANFSFHDNIISNSNCIRSKENTYYLDVRAEANRNIPNRVTDISSNIFNNISATFIVRLQGSGTDHAFNGSINANQFIDNKATESIVLLDTKHLNLTENIFDSPKSLFDVYVVERGNDVINASYNWWGSPDIAQSYFRIYDGREDNNLLTLNITPILTARTIDCSAMNNCSSNGVCVTKNRCRCHSGWRDDTCSVYDCAGVNYCYGNGVCIGPNHCKCSSGWTGQLCIDAACSNANNCSGHGICVRPDVCRCAARFKGNNCSSCIDQHWGSLCQPCPACVNGACNLNTGTCTCDGNNWTGRLCDHCSETFYGPSCLPLMMALSVVPSQGRDTGGNLVRIYGHNFPEPTNSSYKCRFDTDIVNGTWEAWNRVSCPVPQHAKGEVTLEISADGVTYTDNKLSYTYYATCPPSACGRQLNPPHGQCLFGGCSCNLPWAGNECERELLAPVIEEPKPRQTISESSTYTYSFKLKQGEAPIRWEIEKGPDGMTMDERTATVEWQFAFASASPIIVRVTARNRIGSDTVQWEIIVPVSYYPSVSGIAPTGTLSFPRPVRISGEVTFVDPGSAQIVPVDVIVSNNVGGQTILQTLTDFFTPTTFSVTYKPKPDDAGEFTVVAQHPTGNTQGNTTLSWSVYGMKCVPSYVPWEGIIEGNLSVFENISSLVNTGGIAIDTISAEVNGLPGAYVRRSGSSSSAQPFLDELSEDGLQSFDLVVPNPRPLSGTIYVVFNTAGGLSARLRVYIRLSIRKPLLVFNPSTLTENINKGSQRLISIDLTNMGEVSAKNCEVDFPTDPRIALVSFALADEVVATNSSRQSTGLVIPPKGRAVVTMAVTVGPSEALGSMSGRIAVNTELTTGLIYYIFYITSSQTLTLNVSVTDEFTYFASDKPTVPWARVLLKNPRRNYNQERITTNMTDAVLFEDIHEDRYTLFVEADGHSTYSAVIIVSQDNAHFEAFLKRTAVKYTWTVTQTTVKDVYRITMESTFETFVPMPVITIEPAKINTIPYELGSKNLIEFEVTNHGLIKADNIRFALPSAHPYLIFEMAICGLAMLYDLICGGVQTYTRDVTLTREYPGRPPLPCGITPVVGGDGDGYIPVYPGSVSPDGGTSPSRSRSTSVTYNPVTPLTCDCAKTFIKSCILAYNDYIGCKLARDELATSLSSERTGGGDIVLSTLSVILGLCDTAMACVFGEWCKPCGWFYTTIRCLIDLHTDCGSSRRRREISSDVVYNVLDAAQPMDNYLKIMEEIFGDEKMYDLGSGWYGSFKKAVSDDSDNGFLLSATEVSSVLTTLPDSADQETLNKFLQRWNNTAAAWNNGTLNEPNVTKTRHVINVSGLSPRVEQYLTDFKAAKEKGYNSIFDEYGNAVHAYTEAEKKSKRTSGKEDNSVCAKVRVRIEQELVLTRDAFNAKLELENGEQSALEDIHVEIQIRRTYGTGEMDNDKFSIGTPKLIGITGVDGTGALGQDLSGTAEWLIIPYSTAAPMEDVLYDFGGRLSYRVGSHNFSIPLMPDTLTVKSNPSLVVQYFHEKYVRGDDPLTTEAEPIVPFSLCVMVMNAGYGVANSLKITSGQPEIIENEKGLLISFKIIGAQLGDKAISPSLTVDFGDITSFETKTARWLLTSTLKGTFYNYSATFENINPLGDPQLSLLDKLGYHELIHLVQIEDNSDELDDFLVNDIIDSEGMPDRLFNSANGSEVTDVSTANVTAISESSFVRSGSKVYKIIHLNVVVKNGSKYHYTRVENNITSPFPRDNQYLLHASREYGKDLLVDKNIWQTTHILNTFYIHLFDNSEDTDYGDQESDIMYNLTYGPRNMYPPKFNATSYTATLAMGSPVGTPVIELNAYDIDKDTFTFALENSTFQIFTVGQTTGYISLNQPVYSPNTYEFKVEVKDQGIPSKVSSVMVSVSISGDISSSATAPISSTVSQSTQFTSTYSASTSDGSSSSASPTSTSRSTDSVESSSTTTSSSTQSSAVTLRTTSPDTTESSTSSALSSQESTLSTTSTEISVSSTMSTPNSTTSAAMSTTSMNTSSQGSVGPTGSNLSTISSSTNIPVSSSTASATAEQHKDTPSWVIPTAIGSCVFILLVIIIVLFVYMLRMKTRTGMVTGNRSNYYG